MGRIRLTQRRSAARNFAASPRRIAESQADGLFPGDIGNMERRKNYHDPNEYANYEYNDWDLQGSDPIPPDERNSSNIGLMKTARNYRIAKKAALLAQLLLGEKAPAKIVVAQAEDFLRLGNMKLTAALKRWKATETPAEENAPETAPETEDENAPGAGNTPGTTQTTEEGNVAYVNKPEATELDAPAAEDVSELEGKLEDDVQEPEMNIEVPAAAEDIANGMFGDDGKDGKVDADPELEKFFEQPQPDAEKPMDQAVAKTASKKGLKHLSGQPRMASAAGANEISMLEGLWTNLTISTI